MTRTELYNIAIGLLSRRDYSIRELTRYLLRSTPDENMVSAVITQLHKQHFLDDLRIAERERDKRLKKFHGPTRIKQEMKQKGIPDDIITQGFCAGIPENSVTKAKSILICITLNKLRVM